MDDVTLGRHAATVIRDKAGRKMDMHAEMVKDREKTEKQREKEKKYSQWSKGYVKILCQSLNVVACSNICPVHAHFFAICPSFLP